MADVWHDFFVDAPVDAVYRCLSTPQGLDQWWTQTSAGKPALGEVYDLGFGPEHVWRGLVTKCTPNKTFEMELTEAADDWTNTRVGFVVEPSGTGTQVHFLHTGWPELSVHYKTSCYCWAMYLRILKRYVEHGETVPYEKRLDV